MQAIWLLKNENDSGEFEHMKLLNSLSITAAILLGATSLAYAGGQFGRGIAGLIVGLIIVFVIFLIFREFFCWYWKINQRVAILNEIRDLLKSGADDGTVPEEAIVQEMNAISPENMTESQKEARALFKAGLEAILQFRNDEGKKMIIKAAQMGDPEANKFIESRKKKNKKS